MGDVPDAEQENGSSSSSSSSLSDYEIIRSPIHTGPRVNLSDVCGLVFPVPRITAMLKVHHYAGRISKRGAIFLTAALEYLTTEIIELSLNVARTQNKNRIKPKHINKAIKADPDLSVNFRQSTVMQGGVYTSPAAGTTTAQAVPGHPVPATDAQSPVAGPSGARRVVRSKKSVMRRQRG